MDQRTILLRYPEGKADEELFFHLLPKMNIGLCVTTKDHTIGHQATKAVAFFIVTTIRIGFATNADVDMSKPKGDIIAKVKEDIEGVIIAF